MLLFEFLNLFSLNLMLVDIFSQYDEDGYPIENEDSWEEEIENDDDFYSDDYEDEDEN